MIFTNESNIERWKNKRQVAVDSKLGRLNGFIKLVNVPIQVIQFDKHSVSIHDVANDLVKLSNDIIKLLIHAILHSCA